MSEELSKEQKEELERLKPFQALLNEHLNPDCYYRLDLEDIEGIRNAMKEYAKQQLIDYANYLNDEMQSFIDVDTVDGFLEKDIQ
jgi:hypothetical protein